MPSHVDRVRNVPFEHEAETHTVPAAYLRHAPEPLQVPSLPQLAAPLSLHVPVGSTPPAGTGLQEPALPGRLHEKQLPLHAVEQQTPCAHVPDEHCPPELQTAPFGSKPQERFWHVFDPEHCMLLEQVV